MTNSTRGGGGVSCTVLSNMFIEAVRYGVHDEIGMMATEAGGIATASRLFYADPVSIFASV